MEDCSQFYEVLQKLLFLTKVRIYRHMELQTDLIAEEQYDRQSIGLTDRYILITEHLYY